MTQAKVGRDHDIYLPYCILHPCSRLFHPFCSALSTLGNGALSTLGNEALSTLGNGVLSTLEKGPFERSGRGPFEAPPPPPLGEILATCLNIPNIKIPTYIIPYENIVALPFPRHLESLVSVQSTPVQEDIQ